MIKIITAVSLAVSFMVLAPTVRAGSCFTQDSTGINYCGDAEGQADCKSGQSYSQKSCEEVSGQASGTGNFGSAGGFAKEAAGKAGVDVESTLETKVASVVNYMLSLLGIIFLMLMVYGGYIWMMARGEEAEAKRAKGIITMGIIGMAIVIGAYAVTFFIVSRLVAGAS